MTRPEHTLVTGDGGADPFTMNLFHAALLRDLTRARLLLDGSTAITPRRTRRLGQHLIWLVEALRIHHQGEDEQLWPTLREREPGTTNVLDAMLAEHHAIDEPMAQLEATASALAAVRSSPAAHERAAVLSAIDRLAGPLEAHLSHEEQMALPIVRRVLTQSEWNDFERTAWAARRTRGGTLRFAPWLLDGLRWTPYVRQHFAPARRVPRPVLLVLAGSSRVPGLTVWSGTPAAATPPCIPGPGDRLP